MKRKKSRGEGDIKRDELDREEKLILIPQCEI
jgi:hypothetical protein